MSVSAFALILLLTVGALAGLPALAGLLPRPRMLRPLPLAAGLAVLAGLAASACAAVLIVGGAATLVLPLGLPGSPAGLALDPFASLLMLPILLGIAASLVAAPRGPAATDLGALLALSVLLLLAADAPTLGLAAVATLLLLGRIARPARPVRVRAALIVGACLAAAPALLPVLAGSTPAGDSNTAAGAAAYGLALLAGLSLAALPPFGTALPSVPPDSVAPAIAVSLRPLLGSAVLLRLLVANAAAPPAWWCAAPLAIGAVAAASGAAIALVEIRLDRISAGLARQAAGATLVGIGLTLLARASDLPLLAALALAGTLLQLTAATLGLLLLALADAVIASEAGSQRLDRLGGLIHRLPGTAWSLLVGLASLAALPLTAGFAGAWLLLQAALAAMRAAGPASALLVLLSVAGLGAAAGFSAIAATRLFAVTCLGRPRSPRAAAATLPPLPTRLTLAALASLLGLLGLAPSLGLRLVVPALAAVLPEGRSLLADGRQGARPDVASLDMVGFAPLLLCGAALVIAVLLRWLVRSRCRQPAEAEGWDGGFARPPPWLPFGDPALQANAASLAWPLAEILPRWLNRRPIWSQASRLAWRLRRLARRPPQASRHSGRLFLPALLIAALAWLWLAPAGTGR